MDQHQDLWQRLPALADETEGLTCPECRIPMAQIAGKRITIDWCRECRGVWLDHGEEKALRNAAEMEPKAQSMAIDDLLFWAFVLFPWRR